MGPRGVGRQRHRRRLQRRAFLRGRRGALLLRRHVSDAEPDRRQGHHRHRRLRVTAPTHSKSSRRSMKMASTTSTLALAPAPPSAATLTLANVLYEKKGAIAYVMVNRPKV